MKYAKILTFALIALMVQSGLGQGMTFETGNWASILKKAKKEKKLIYLDAYTSWCGPCKMIAPVLDEMAKEYGGRLQIAKMNVDDNREVPGKFGIRGIPTLMIFKGGQKVAELTGARPKRELTAFVDGHL